MAGLRVLWFVCGWFVGGLSDLCLVLMVCGWFPALQLTGLRPVVLFKKVSSTGVFL